MLLELSWLHTMAWHQNLVLWNLRLHHPHPTYPRLCFLALQLYSIHRSFSPSPALFCPWDWTCSLVYARQALSDWATHPALRLRFTCHLRQALRACASVSITAGITSRKQGPVLSRAFCFLGSSSPSDWSQHWVLLPHSNMSACSGPHPQASNSILYENISTRKYRLPSSRVTLYLWMTLSYLAEDNH